MKNLPIIIAVVSIFIALFAVGVALSPKQQITTMDPTIANSNSTAVAPTKKTSFVSKLTGVIDVATLYENKEAYAGEKINVRGEIQINPQYGEQPCPATEPSCETLAGINLYLLGKPLLPNMGNIIQIYKAGKPYPCVKVEKNFVCGNFKNGETRTVAGTWIQSKEPAQTVGNSSGSYQVLKWRDVYYLEVE